MTHPENARARALPEGVERKELAVEIRGVLEGDSGGFQGYVSPFGQLDSYGDIVLPGAYAWQTAAFLRDGWIAADHEWGVEKERGYPIDAAEDDYGYLLTCEFHDDEKSQALRRKVTRRLARGKSVKMSIGFTIPQGGAEIVTGEEAVTYLKNPTPEQIEACRTRATVRLLRKIKLYEGSIVSVPAATGADVVSAKSAEGEGETAAADTSNADTTGVETKADVLGEYVEGQMTMSAIVSAFDALMWHVMYPVCYDGEAMDAASKMLLVEKGCDEFKALCMKVCAALVCDEDAMSEGADEIRALIPEPTENDDSVSLRAGLRLQDRFARALAAAEAYRAGVKAVDGLRRKEGRVLSQSNCDRIDAHATALDAIATDLRTMLDEARPKAATPTGSPTESPTDSDATDTAVADTAGIDDEQATASLVADIELTLTTISHPTHV